MIKKYINRPTYTNKITPFIGKDIIKCIIGQRRVGKSYLLFQLMDVVKKRGAKNIIYINKELHDFDNITNYSELIKYVSEKTKSKKTCLFLDEIQEISQFEKALRHFHATGNYDIYCTGSNANMLSGELASTLSGRCLEIEVFGLSYIEFLKFHKLENSEKSLQKYMTFGGLPFLKNLALTEDIVFEYLRNIYNTILLKDIIKRYNIRNTAFLEKLVRYAADNIGSIVSAKKISDYLKSQKTSLSPNIVLNYLSYLTSAFLMFKVQRADIVGKKIFEIGEKYYFEDLGLRNTIISFSLKDINKILENLVYIHLRRLGYKVSIGILGNKEIDFVCERAGEKQYVQVAYLISEKTTFEREFGNLIAINDNHPKTVISMDSIQSNYQGIHHIHIKDFLSKNIF